MTTEWMGEETGTTVAAPPLRPVLALPTLGPLDVLPAASGASGDAFPLNDPGFEPTYLGRNAVWRAVKRLGLEGSEVLVPAYHHGVEISALMDAGASPRFVRVEGATLLLDLDDAAAQISARTRALYLIHYAGFPQRWEAARALCRKHGLFLIEDCALATFSADGDRALGSIGDAAIFCFYKTVPVPHGGGLLVRKEVATTEGVEKLVQPPLLPTISHTAGSMFLTGERTFGRGGAWARRIVRGATDPFVTRAWKQDVPVGNQYFDRNVVRLGMSRITGWVLKRVDAHAIVRRRRENWTRLHERLGEPNQAVWDVLPRGVCPLFYGLRVDDKGFALEHLRARGIEAIDFWRWPHPAAETVRYPEVERLRREVLELPCHQDLSDEEVDRIADAARALLRE